MDVGKFTEPVASDAMSGLRYSMEPRSESPRPRPPVENCTIMPGQCFLTPSCTRAKRSGSEEGRPASSRTWICTSAAPASKAACVDSICSSGVIGTAGLLAFCGRDPVMATLMTAGRDMPRIIPQFGSTCLSRAGGIQSRMLSESETVLHSWCRQADWAAPTIVGGAGARIHTADGRSILDMSSLAECCNLGHQHPKVVAAIREQAQKLCFVTSAWGAEPRARLAGLLLEKSGFAGGRVFFTLGGADANENAVKFARQASGKPRGRIVARDRSYHGASYAAMAMSGDSRTRHQVDPDAFGVLHAPPPYAYRCPYGSKTAEECGDRAAAAVGELIDTHPDVAAVI